MIDDNGRTNEIEQVSTLVDRINEAWVAGRLDELAELVDDDIVMVFPGFEGRSEGKPAFVAGFEDFVENAELERFEESDRQIDVKGDAAVASFAFEIVYGREGRRYLSTGRDLWVFARRDAGWRPVWRTMLDVGERPVAPDD